MTFSGSTDTFETYCDEIDVTMLSRPDTSWRFTDAHGHEHRWYARGQPATHYSPTERYDVPTTKAAQEGSWFSDDGDEYPIMVLRCLQCDEKIIPGKRADDHRQTVPGLRYYLINGEPVSEAEFRARAEQAMKQTNG